jgi:hypothetical protein
MKTWWRLLHHQSSRLPNKYFWRHISYKGNLWTCFVTCQLIRDICDQIVVQDYSLVTVQRSSGPCECSRLGIKSIDEQQTVYGVACNGLMIKQNLNLRRNLLTKCKSVMSHDSLKEQLKHIWKPDKWQPTGCMNPCSQLHISQHRPPAHGQAIENC